MPQDRDTLPADGDTLRTVADDYDESLEHRLATVPELANRVLRVIVSKDEPKRVISVYLDRKLKGKL